MKMTLLIQKAINFAAYLHRKQTRKTSSLPYIVHPYSVAVILSNYTDDEHTIAAGLLHDVLEDVDGYSASDMDRDFGETVTSIVQEVTEDKSIKDWQQRKQKYLDHLATASLQAQLVCAADKIHNLQSIVEAYQKQGEALWDKFNAPPDKKLWLYEEVLKMLQTKLDSSIVVELEKTLNEARNLVGEGAFKDMKVAFINCDNCDFTVGFEHDNRAFFYCPTHKFGVNVPTEKLTVTQMCRPCDKPLERYELYDEDNVCPLCRGMISVMYVPKKK